MAILKNSRRDALNKDKTTLFIIVSAAAVIVVFALVFSKTLWSQGNYLNKVVAQKEAAKDQLNKNKEAAVSLKASYDEFTSKNPNLIGGNKEGKGQKDGDNAKLVLDALPSKYDFPALLTSMEQLLQGYNQATFAVTDQTSAVVAGGITEVPLTVGVTTSYAGFNDFIDTLERSIKPIHVTNLSINGTSAKMTLAVTAKTFYQAETSLQVTTGEVQ